MSDSLHPLKPAWSSPKHSISSVVVVDNILSTHHSFFMGTAFSSFWKAPYFPPSCLLPRCYQRELIISQIHEHSKWHLVQLETEYFHTLLITVTSLLPVSSLRIVSWTCCDEPSPSWSQAMQLSPFYLPETSWRKSVDFIENVILQQAEENWEAVRGEKLSKIHSWGQLYSDLSSSLTHEILFLMLIRVECSALANKSPGIHQAIPWDLLIFYMAWTTSYLWYMCDRPAG